VPTPIGRSDVQRLMRESAQVVEVLPASEYERDHLPGALSMPLRTIDEQARRKLDPARAVVVYCWDSA
jgi:rhodanese-related sulfurtransferase